MTKIKIVALNKRAEEVIKLERKVPLRSKLALRVVGFTEEIISEKPFIMICDYKNIHTNKELALNLAIEQIIKDLRRNEVMKDRDYTIEMVTEALE